MSSSNTFIRISMSIPEVKKSAFTSDWENAASKVFLNKFGLSQIQLGEGWGAAALEKFCNFSSLLILETVVPALKLTRNCYLNMSISSS